MLGAVLLAVLLVARSGSAALAVQPLVAYWNMNQGSIAGFTAASGSCAPAADVTSATFTAGTGTVLGTSGGASGFGNYLSLSSANPAAQLSSFVMPTSAISISFKFTTGATANNKSVHLLTKGSLLAIFLTSSSNQLLLSATFTTSVASYSIVTSTAVVADTWYTATFTYSGSSAALYLNTDVAN